MEEGIKTYMLMDIVRNDHIAKTTVHEKLEEYIPIKIEDAWTRNRFKIGRQKRPYTVKYIRMRELARYLKKCTGKEILFKWEEKSEWLESRPRYPKGK